MGAELGDLEWRLDQLELGLPVGHVDAVEVIGDGLPIGQPVRDDLPPLDLYVGKHFTHERLGVLAVKWALASPARVDALELGVVPPTRSRRHEQASGPEDAMCFADGVTR